MRDDSLVKVHKCSRWDLTRGKYQSGYSAAIGDLEAWAGNRREACEAVKGMAVAALEGSYEPLAISAHGITVVVFRTPVTGWTYATLAPDGRFASGHVLRSDEAANRDLAERTARRSMAQIIFTHDGPDGSGVLSHPEDLQSHRDWTSWQYRYREAVEAGASKDEAHAIASRFWREGEVRQEILGRLGLVTA